MTYSDKTQVLAEESRPLMLHSLERESARPLYEQIADRLRERIASSMQVGSQLLTEEAMMELYEVSRSTIRKAVQRLVDEAVLVRQQGKGTFVTRPMPKIIHSIDHMAPFIETFRQVGEDINTSIINFSWNENPNLPKELDSWERPILTYQRLYVSRGVPHAITQITVPMPIGRKITREDADSSPIYDILQKKLKLRLARAEFLVSCRQPSSEISTSLEISQSSFLLVLDRITRDKSGQAVEMTTHFLRPDVYQLSVVLKDLVLAPTEN